MRNVVLLVLTAAVASLVACTGKGGDSTEESGVVDSGSVAE